MSEKIYVGGAKEMTGNFGSFHKISFSKDDLDKLAENLNAKGYVNLAMNKRRQPSQYGQTHSLVIDTWQPEAQQVQQFQQNAHTQHQAPVYTPPAHTETPQQVFQNVEPTTGNDPSYSPMEEDCPF